MKCSFCNRDDCKKMVTPENENGVAICSECILGCVEVLIDGKHVVHVNFESANNDSETNSRD